MLNKLFFITILGVIILCGMINPNIYSQIQNEHFIISGNEVLSRDWKFIPDFDNEYIYYFDKTTSSLKRLFDNYKGIIPQKSPKGKYISFFGTKNVIGRLWKNGWREDLKLTIFSAGGRKLIKSFDIQPSRYCWSPDEDKILYGTLGKWVEARERKYMDVWLLVVKTNSRYKIFESALKFTWAKYDSNIYIMDINKKVYKYDLKNRTTELTPYLDVNFCDNGKYYFQLESEMPLKLFVRRNSMDITDRFATTVKKYLQVNAPGRNYNETSIKWFSGSTLIFLDDIGSKSYIYDVDADKIIESLKGYFLGLLDEEKKEAVIIHQGKPEVKKLNLKAQN